MKHWLSGHAAVAAWMMLAAVTADPACARDEDEARVRTTAGVVAGVSTGSGTVFKGIPYAAPPTGPLRWRSPQRVAPWSGIRSADTFGPPCAQAPLRGMTQLSDLSREDCLYLNVWTPRQTGGARRPVIVWIHGGGFVNGSGTSPTYDGARFAAEGVVVVTINYRLGVFGFLAHPDLTAESRNRSSGNFGLEDQIAALRWVQANIASFGGDPSNVTLMGQSAGGASVLDLMVSPLTRGLFVRAIVQSGAARQAIAPVTIAEAEKRGVALAGPQGIAALRGLDKAGVLALVDHAPRDIARFGPAIDGHVLTHDPASGLKARSGKPLALLIGSNSREGLGTPDAATLGSEIARAFGPNAGKALRYYGIAEGRAGTADPLLGTPAEQFATDVSFRCGAVEIARIAAGLGAPIWHYQFEQFVPGREHLGAAHSAEVPYVFGTLSPTGFAAANYGDADRRLSALMTRYWANFARTGNPNGAGLPDWPGFTSARPDYVRFSSAFPQDVQPASDLRGDLCRLLPDTSQPGRK
ncbi:carboxylesterase family protein [Sphingomonas sp. HF-S3]|uniref:Carboxylic ester hydrolase n=1 Tax=Sphingomonas rustica TaxID=3103142 RepID=A0ABV0B610_9SPHN